MIKAVIFDCFGVLVTENWLPFKKKYFSVDKALFEEVTDLGKQLNSGFIAYDDFIAEVAERAGISPEKMFDEINGNRVNEKLFAYIADNLKQKFKIGMLSNIGDNWLQNLFSHEELNLFDRLALSYKTGLLKPDNRAYEKIAEKLAVNVSECVFVDDQERHCRGAREAGMRAIRYKDFEQMKDELEKILVEAK